MSSSNTTYYPQYVHESNWDEDYLLFVAVILNSGLFGVLSLQVYLYYQAFPNDRTSLKVLVCVIYLLEMAQTLLWTDTAWNMLVRGYANIEALDQVGTLWLSTCVIGGLIGLLLQWFYSYRIAVISRKRIMPGIVIFMSLVSFAGAVATAVDAKQERRLSKLLYNERLAFTVIALWAGTSFICNMTIAVCMCYCLLKFRSNPYGKFSQTEALTSKMVRLTIETGALNAAISTLTISLFYARGSRGFTYFLVPLCVHAKFYSTTTLAVLNSRMKLGIVSQSTAWRDNELPIVPPHPRDADRVDLSITSTNDPIQNISVHVTKEEVVTVDEPKVHYLVPSIH